MADIMGLIDAVGKHVPKVFGWEYDNTTGDHARGGITPAPCRTSLASMAMLFEKFDRKLTIELVGVLQNHRAIVTDMGNTFTAANKRYASTEGANANTFQPPTTGTPWWDTIATYNSTPAADWKEGPGLPTTAGSGVSFDTRAKTDIESLIESGNYFGLLAFANIAEMIAKNGGTTFWIAGEWNAFAEIWRRSAQKFTDTIGHVFTNGYWQGTGADNAIGFLDKYNTATQTLHRAMLDMSHVIGNTANFNAFIWSHLPRYDQFTYNTDHTVKYVNNKQATSHLPRVQTFWNTGDDTSASKGYVTGIKQLATLIPTLPDPNTLAPATHTTPTGNNNETSGND
ncbi:hypothetical protein, partial [Nocardia sp. NPDC056564]|uniref:hypothetical protein n=1 Tax=Nocardia sp. NPDC056564 TaxID=3345865 RepID=UPI00366B0677